MIQRAELISTGTELLDGRRINTHARHIAIALKTLGIRLVRDTSIPDDPEQLAEVTQQALERCNLVFITGGLGPTPDDLTVDTLARWLQREVTIHPETAATIRARFAAKGPEGIRLRERQARHIAGATILPNSAGAAPGQLIPLPQGHLILLPGPPRELEAILTDCVLPWLAAQPGARPPRPEASFMVTGLGESDLMHMLEEAQFPPAGLEAAYCARPGRIEVHFEAEEASQLIQACTRFEHIAGNFIYSRNVESIFETVAQLLQVQHLTLGVAESCTGGMLGEFCTAIPGSSEWFSGGIIAYSNAVKMSALGIPQDLLDKHGAVSEPTAAAMAEGVRKAIGCDLGVAITGIAGPGGGTKDKPVGTVCMAVSRDTGTNTYSRRFPGTREAIRQWSAHMAMWYVLKSLSPGPL